MTMPAALAGSGLSAAGAVLRGSLAQNRMRTALAVLAIALGVALGYAVQLINQAAVNELAQGVQALSGEADLEVRGPRAGFDEALYPMLARAAGRGGGEPGGRGRREARGPRRHAADRRHRCLPRRIRRARRSSPPMADRLDTLRPDALFLTPAAMRALAVGVGDEIHVQVGLADVPLRIAGELRGGGSQRFAVMDIAGAQAAFGRIGRITPHRSPPCSGRRRRGIRRRDCASSCRRASMRNDRRRRWRQAPGLSRSYRVNLDVLALVALFTGGLLVFSTQALAVVRRRAQFALLRVLGVTRRRLTALIVAEGALIGAAGSALGIAGGFALAGLAVRVVGTDLGSGYFRGVAPTLIDRSGGACIVLRAGRRGRGRWAASCPRSRPRTRRPRRRSRPATRSAHSRACAHRCPGVVAIVIGAAATALPPIAGLPLAGYACNRAAARRHADAVAAHRRERTVGAARATRTRAGARAGAAPRRSGAADGEPRGDRRERSADGLDGHHGGVVPRFARCLAASASCRRTSMCARRPRERRRFSAPDVQREIAALPGVRRAEFLREQQLALDPARVRVVLLARAIDRANPARSLPLLGAPLDVPADAPPPVWVNEAAADLYGFAPGAVIALPLNGKTLPFTVAGVWRDYGRPQGAIAMERERYVELTGDATVTNGALWLAEGADRAAVEAAIRRAIPGGERLEIDRSRRDSRAVAADFRPHVRGHLCARARGRRHRPRRTVIVVRRARARAAPRIRRAAPSRHDAAAGRRDARDGGAHRERHRPRRRARARLRHQPDPDPRGQPAVVSLGDGSFGAVGRAGRICGRRARCSRALRRSRAAAARWTSTSSAQSRTTGEPRIGDSR